MLFSPRVLHSWGKDSRSGQLTVCEGVISLYSTRTLGVSFPVGGAWQAGKGVHALATLIPPVTLAWLRGAPVHLAASVLLFPRR